MPKLSELLGKKSEDSKTESAKPAENIDKPVLTPSDMASEPKQTVRLSEVITMEDTAGANQEEVNFMGKLGRSMVGSAVSGDPTQLVRDAVQGRLLNNDPLLLAKGDVALGAMDSASFGIPRAVAKKILNMSGMNVPEIEDKTAYEAGQIIGLLVPGKAAVSLANKIPGVAGRGILKSMARGTAEGAAVGFTQSPDEFLDLKQRIVQAGTTAAVGAAMVPASKGIENLARVSFKAKGFAEKVRASLMESKSNMGKQFASQLDDLIERNPNQVVNLEEPFMKISETAKTNSRLVNDLKLGAKRAGVDADLIEGFIKNPASATEMTLNQSRQIKNVVDNVPSIKTNLKKGKFGNFSETDIDLIDFADEVRSKQLSAFPELAGINKAYSEGITKYNMVKDKFKVGKLLDNMEKNFGDKEVQSVINSLLPKEIVKEMGGYRAAAKFLKYSGWIAASGFTGAALTAGGLAASKALQGAGVQPPQ